MNLASEHIGIDTDQPVAPQIKSNLGKGFLREQAALHEIELAPPPSKLLTPQVLHTPHERRLGVIWNSYGRLLASLAAELQVEPAVALAVLAVESGGKPFAGDGRMIIRFENHLFFRYWGVQHRERFDQHFQFDPTRGWLGHQWRPTPDSAWRLQHLATSTLDENQIAEWDVFTFASSLDDEAARLASSLGAPQIMGFNYGSIGYESVGQMFSAFAESAHAQFIGMFDYIKSNPTRIWALQKADFHTFAELYNGPGQADHYGQLIQSNVALFNQLIARQPGLSFNIPSPESFIVDEQGISFLPPLWPLLLEEQAGDAGHDTPDERDSESPSALRQELEAAWVEHICAGLENNRVMFKHILRGFMIPYYLTVAMYLALFIVGIGLFVMAVRVGSQAGSMNASLAFGGLSVVAFLAFFLRNPLRSLEENLQFITWLGLTYNTYWTQLLYIQDRETVRQDLKEVTQTAIDEIERMLDKSTKLAAQRFQFRWPWPTPPGAQNNVSNHSSE